jgi:hypothetical protein
LYIEFNNNDEFGAEFHRRSASPLCIALTMARPSRSTPKSTTSTPQKSQSTPKSSLRARSNEKSKYFEPPTDEEESSFNDDELESTSVSSAIASESEDEPPKKKSKTTPTKKTANNTPKKGTVKSRLSKGKEESDDEPWETFVPKEDTPDAGDIEYQNTSIHPNTLQFLRGT